MENGLGFNDFEGRYEWDQKISPKDVTFDKAEIKEKLLNLNENLYVVKDNDRFGVSNVGPAKTASKTSLKVIAFIPAFSMDKFGNPDFKDTFGTKFCLYGGAMANGIASEEMVIALGKAGFFGSFGSAGLVPSRVEEAIKKIQKELPDGPYAFNLIHSPNEPAMEQGAVDLYLKHEVKCIEAAAYMGLTPQIVQYKASGLSRNRNNEIVSKNRIIAKISRREVAARFLAPPTDRVLQPLVEQNLITRDQAEMAKMIPMADDITVEADSGGHTDNRPLVSLLPSIISLRNEMQEKYKFKNQVRVGAGGGIGTPQAALAAFMMGAAYLVTGSINQGCIESGTSDHVKTLLSTVDMADIIMAPAADMFEMGVDVQVLKRGTLFAMRAKKLYELYNNYESIEDIPVDERAKLEKTVFKRNLDDIWSDTVEFFTKRDPGQIERALNHPKRKMALIFRWYLGLSSRWANSGEKGREMDFQIWCGAAMGAFNAWTTGTYLAKPENRTVADVNKHVLNGAAFYYRIQNLQSQGVVFSSEIANYVTQKKMES